MNPDERLQRIVEEQRELRLRLSQLEQEIGLVRLMVDEQRAPSHSPAAKAATMPEEVLMATRDDSSPEVVEPDERGYVPPSEPAAPPPLPGAPVALTTAKLADAPAPVAAIPAMEVQSQKLENAPPSDSPAPPLLPVIAEVKKEPVREATYRTAVAPVPVARPASGDLEMRLGKVWFVRIGVIAILTGLALGSVYAYQNFIQNTSPIIKVLALYAVAGLMTGMGMWLERSRESLKIFGRVITAGGMAATFYTTYAMYHVERLQVIESPLVAGVLLLLCALGIFVYADVRRDQTVAAMSLMLGYYGTSIHEIGWFSLFSNLVLTVGGLWFLWRRRWVALGALSLVGSYGGFAFWQYALPLMTTGQLAPMPYWAGQGFVLSCWVLFTAVLLLAEKETMAMAWRGTLAALNNSGFFALFTIAMLARLPAAERSDAFAHFALGWGAVQLVLCWVSELRHGKEGRPLGEMYLAFGLMLVSLGLAVKMSGYQLATVFAFQAAVLSWLGAKQNRIIAKIGTGVLAGAVLMSPLDGEAFIDQVTRVDMTLAQTVAVYLQTALLLLAGWFSRGVLKVNGLSVWLCLAAWLVLASKTTLPAENWVDLAMALGMAGVWLVLGDQRLLKFTEMRRIGTVTALYGALLLADKAWIGLERGNWLLTPGSVSVLAVMLLVLTWICRRDAWIKVNLLGKLENVSVEVFLLGALAWLSWTKVVILPLDFWWDGTALLIASGALYSLGWWKVSAMRELMVVARFAALGSAVLIGIEAYEVAATGKPELLDMVGAGAAGFLLLGAAWLARHRSLFKWEPIEGGLDWVPLVHSIAAVGSMVLTIFWPLDQSWQPAGWVLFCALLLLAGKLRKISLPELSLVSGFAPLVVTAYWWLNAHANEPKMAGLWLVLAFVALMVAAMLPAKHWPESGLWTPVLSWLAGLQATAVYLRWWWIHEPEFFVVATAAAGLAMGILARWKHVRVAGGFAFVLTTLALLGLAAALFFDSRDVHLKAQNWDWLVPLMAMATEWCLRSGALARSEEERVWGRALGVAAVAVWWSYLTFHVFADGEFRTISWAALALGVFVVGIALGHSTYRRCGLAVLALALGRVVVYDVWQLGTAARFASFLAIGAVLVLLGFFYNRFEDFIRKYL